MDYPYKAQILINRRVYLTIKETDPGELESRIQAELQKITRRQQEQNRFVEVRVRYV
jgi:hypothetical protein